MRGTTLYHTEGEDIHIKGVVSTDYEGKPYVEIEVGKQPLSFVLFFDMVGLQKLHKVVEELGKVAEKLIVMGGDESEN